MDKENNARNKNLKETVPIVTPSSNTTPNDKAYRESHAWFTDNDGTPLFISEGISLGLIAQLYVFERLAPNAGTQTMSGNIAVKLKELGYDWHAKFLTGRLHHSAKPPSQVIKEKKIAILYDVRSQAILDSNNAIARALLSNGVEPIALLSDPGMLSLMDPKLPAINYSAFYGLKDEVQSLRQWKSIHKTLNEVHPLLVERFSAFLNGDHKKAIALVDFLYPFFRQALRDIIAIQRLAENLNISKIVMGSDSHRLSRLFALMGSQHSWRTLVIQHGAPMAPDAYVPVFADTIAVWGECSYDWFLSYNTPPERMKITGNPRYDHLRAVLQAPASSDSRIVLLTNLFDPDLRDTILNIAFDAACSLKLPLVIKIHPSEQTDAYYKFARRNSPIPIHIHFREKIDQVIRAGDMVVTVSSTSGIEALLLGASLHHIAVDNIANTIPFEEFQAATFARTTDDLINNLTLELSGKIDISYRHECVSRLLNYYLCEIDGRSSERIINVINGLSEDE